MYHGKQFSILIKEKSEFAKTYNINIKTPVIIKNALPCNLKIKTKLITGIKHKGSESEETQPQYDNQDEEFSIEKATELQLYNFNLKDFINFRFTLDQSTTTNNNDTEGGGVPL